jgi:hypothetical protein
METKVCNRCKIEKDLTFYKLYFRSGKNKPQLNAYCILCDRERKKEYAKKVYGSEAYLKRKNKYRNSNKYYEKEKERGIIRLKITQSDIYYNNCICCDLLYVSKKQNPKYKLCKKCNIKFNHKKYYPKYKSKDKQCKCTDCGILFIGKHIKSKCIKCKLISEKKYAKEYRKKNKYQKKHITRAKHYGCYIEDVKPIKVFKRDKFKCQVCGIKCDINKHYNSNDYPTLGHIVPLSLKGSHTYSNCQCECRKCNSIKSNKILGQQMTIFCLDPGQG